MERTKPKHALLGLLAFIIFSALCFVIPYQMIAWVFGQAVPPLSIIQALFLGNFSSISFAIGAGWIGKVMYGNKEILNRQ